MLEETELDNLSSAKLIWERTFLIILFLSRIVVKDSFKRKLIVTIIIVFFLSVRVRLHNKRECQHYHLYYYSKISTFPFYLIAIYFNFKTEYYHYYIPFLASVSMAEANLQECN